MARPKQSFGDFIKNKKVVLVGPARTLLNKSEGNRLDGFDIQVRTNGSILLLKDEEFRRDYGSRCDILYSNVQFHREMGPFPLQRWHNDHALKYLCMKTSSPNILANYDRVVPSRSVMHIIREFLPKVPGLLMGPIIIEDLLRHNPAQLYVTGFDFYITKPLEFIPGDYREYVEGYLPEKIRTKADVANIGRKDMHDQYHNTKFIYEKWFNNQIEVDEDMKKLMPEIIGNPTKYTNTGKYAKRRH